MQKGLIITCPKHDDTTEYLTYYSKEIIEEAENRGLKVKEVEDKNLNIQDFSKILKNIDYKLVTLNGHGSPNSIFGYKNSVIIQMGENESLLKERMVYARSCNAGSFLGIECMKNSKEGCFIGYQLPFVFFIDSKWSAKPHNDNVSKLFLEPSNIVPISLIKGHSAVEAHDHSKKQMLKVINKLLTSKQEQETPFFIEALWNNYLGQVVHGNKEARL